MKPIWVILLVVVLVSLAFWGGRCTAPKTYSPSVRVAVTGWYPDTIRVERHYYHRLLPLDNAAERALWEKRYDSAYSAAKNNSDSLARYLARPWQEFHHWRMDRPDFLAAGELQMTVDPIAKDVDPRLSLDSLQVATPQREEPDVPSWQVLIGVGLAGTLLGLYVGTR